MPLDMSRVPNAAMMYPAFKDSDRVKGKDGQTMQFLTAGAPKSHTLINDA
jgi:hypothetical protein